jgi:hypothetical protein
MATSWLSCFLTAIFVLIWRHIPFILNSAWYSRRTVRGRLDEDVPLLQLAEAFARRIERERGLIAEKINDPETIREVSRSLVCSKASLNTDPVACCRERPFTRTPCLFGNAQSNSARASSAARNIDANLRPCRVRKEDPSPITRLSSLERHRPQDPRALVVLRTR